MKKSMIVFICITTVFLQGMEAENTGNFLIGKTTVRLTRGCIYDVADQVDLMIIGFHEQRRFKNPLFNKNDYAQGGTVYGLGKGIAYMENKEDTSLSQEDDYNTYDQQELWKNANTKKLSGKVLQVYEPQISLKKDNTGKQDYLYIIEKKDTFFSSSRRVWIGIEALENGKKDLIDCYKTILHPLFDCKTIAIPALSTEVGFPRKEAANSAIDTIVKFLHTSKQGQIKSYDLIHLFVKTRFELERYKKTLSERCQLQLRHKIFLLSCIVHYYEQFSLYLPRETMHYIWVLWHYC